jgi:hypothetical protein
MLTLIMTTTANAVGIGVALLLVYIKLKVCESAADYPDNGGKKAGNYMSLSMSLL